MKIAIYKRVKLDLAIGRRQVRPDRQQADVAAYVDRTWRTVVATFEDVGFPALARPTWYPVVALSRRNSGDFQAVVVPAWDRFGPRHDARRLPALPIGRAWRHGALRNAGQWSRSDRLGVDPRQSPLPSRSSTATASRLAYSELASQEGHRAATLAARRCSARSLKSLPRCCTEANG